MPNMMTYIIFVIFGALVFMLISTSFWSAKGAPSMTSLLGSILPSLEQAEQLNLEDGFKAIHVKIAPDSASPILYEFHPTNEGALGRKHYSHAEIPGSSDPLNYRYYFFLNTWEPDSCALFATGDTGIVTSGWPDMYIYYFNPGAQIRKPDTNFKASLFPPESAGCEKDYGCDVPGKFTVCANSEVFSRVTLDCDDENSDLVNQKFYGVDSTATTDNCVYDEEGCPFIDGKKDCCALADYKTNRNVYKPAYDILCGYEQTINGGWSSEARWYACTGKQDTVIKVDNTEYSCNKINWVVKSGSGVYLSNPQVKYDTTRDDETLLRFALSNNQNEEIKAASIKVDVTNTDKDCYDYTGLIKNDDDTKNINCGDVKPTSPCKFDYDDFCWNAKTFDVKFSYTGGEKNYKIDCKNAKTENEEWQNCISSEISGSLYDLGASFSKTCSSKNYDIKYEGAPSDSVLIGVKENGAVIKQGADLRWTINKGTSETIKNIKVTLYDVSATSPYTARIGAECV